MIGVKSGRSVGIGAVSMPLTTAMRCPPQVRSRGRAWWCQTESVVRRFCFDPIFFGRISPDTFYTNTLPTLLKLSKTQSCPYKLQFAVFMTNSRQNCSRFLSAPTLFSKSSPDTSWSYQNGHFTPINCNFPVLWKFADKISKMFSSAPTFSKISSGIGMVACLFFCTSAGLGDCPHRLSLEWQGFYQGKSINVTRNTAVTEANMSKLRDVDHKV